MANINIDGWIPVEWEAGALQRIAQTSAVEAFAKGYAMNAEDKRVPRSLGMNVSSGSTYVADDTANNNVLLSAVKFTGQATIDEDEMSDAATLVNTIEVKASDWATSYAVAFDNACIGTTAAGNGGTVPFTSIYKAVRTSNSDSGYTADDNYLNNSLSGSGTYDALSETFEKVESGFYWNPVNSLVIAHPGMRDVLRRTKDNDGMPIFVQGLAGTPDTLFGVRIHWSLGARTSAAKSHNPTGNQLLVFVGDADLLMRGDRMGPEALVDRARAHDTTDTAALKLRVRKAFALGSELGVSVLERSAS